MRAHSVHHTLLGLSRAPYVLYGVGIPIQGAGMHVVEYGGCALYRSPTLEFKERLHRRAVSIQHNANCN